MHKIHALGGGRFSQPSLHPLPVWDPSGHVHLPAYAHSPQGSGLSQQSDIPLTVWGLAVQDPLPLTTCLQQRRERLPSPLLHLPAVSPAAPWWSVRTIVISSGHSAVRVTGFYYIDTLKPTNLAAFFIEIGQTDPKIYMELPGTQAIQNNLEKIKLEDSHFLRLVTKL